VTAPLELRRRRALASGWTAERFERTLAAQADDAARAAVADYVVLNDLTEDALEGRADRLWSRLTEDARALGEGRPLPARRRAGGPTRC
jgi:dephospho-CoA kinase